MTSELSLSPIARLTFVRALELEVILFIWLSSVEYILSFYCHDNHVELVLFSAKFNSQKYNFYDNSLLRILTHKHYYYDDVIEMFVTERHNDVRKYILAPV